MMSLRDQISRRDRNREAHIFFTVKIYGQHASERRCLFCGLAFFAWKYGIRCNSEILHLDHEQ